MRKAVFISWDEIPEILTDYFTVNPEDVKVSQDGFTVVTERKAADEADRT